jgi:hypothetical protein
MRVSWLAAIGVALLVAGVGLWVLRRTSDSPERQVLAAAESMAAAARAHDPGGVLEHVSERFESPEVGGKQELRGYLLAELLRGGMVEARLLEPRVEVRSADEARLSGRLLLGRTSGGFDLGQRALDATFVREDGTWRVVRARVEPVE